MNSRSVRMALVAAVLGAIAGCSSLDLGPAPSDYVGPGPKGAQSLTDPDLQAVTPAVTVAAENAAQSPQPPTSLPGQGETAATMPAATQPTTTQPAASTDPATQPGLGTGPTSQPAPTPSANGHVDVPAQLDVQNAILIGLQNNLSLHVQRYSVPIARTNEDAARAVFDPNISGQISGGRTASSRGPTVYSDAINANGQLTEFFPTGTTVTAAIVTNNGFYNDGASSTDASLDVSQSLLRGFGLDVNLAQLRSAELGTKITQFQLRGFAENLVATIEESYWDLAFDERAVVIDQNAVNIAQDTLDSTTAEINVGRLSPSDRPAAIATLEQDKVSLINAKSALEEKRINFLRLITPAGQRFWNRAIILETPPFVPQGAMEDVEKHVNVGLRFRPEINETKLQLQQNDLSIVRTRNGLLPQLDFFVNLNKTAFSSSFFPSFTQLNGPDYSAVAGIRGSYDLGNRAAAASYRASVLTREQTRESFENLDQTIQIDVRTQYIEVERLRQQIAATRASREAADAAFQVELGRFKQGRSTSLQVGVAQQNLRSAQLAEVGAVTDHLKSLVELYRLEGSLLYRRGIDAPGAKPIDAIAWH